MEVIGILGCFNERVASLILSKSIPDSWIITRTCSIYKLTRQMSTCSSWRLETVQVTICHHALEMNFLTEIKFACKLGM